MSLYEPLPRVVARRVPLQWLATVCAAVPGLLFLSNWPTYYNLVLDGPIPLIYYTVPVLLAAMLSISRPSVLIGTLREPLAIWYVLYVLSSFIWLLAAGPFGEVAARQCRLRLLAFTVFLPCLMLIREANRQHLAALVVSCAIFASVNNWVDLLSPFGFVFHGSDYWSVGRGAGLFVNANQAGTAVIAMGIAGVPFVRMRYRWLVMALVLLGVYPTFSRSAFLCAAIMVLGAAAMGQVNRKQIVLLAGVAVALLATGWTILEHGTHLRDVDITGIKERLDIFVSGDETLDESTRARMYAATAAWTIFAESPLVGGGIGSSLVGVHSMGPHNMYLMLAAEQGFLGALLYLSLLGVVLLNGVRLRGTDRPSVDRDLGASLVLIAAFFACIGFFSHTLLEEPSTLFVLAFLVAARRATIRSPAFRHLPHAPVPHDARVRLH